MDNAGGSPALAGRVAVVTGGTRGIGLAIARAFLAAGAEVLVCGRTAPGSAPEAARSPTGAAGSPPDAAGSPADAARSPLEAAGRRASFTAADVRDPAQARTVIDAAVDRYGRLDVLVNNAGGSPPADAATVSPRFVEKIVALNLLAPFYLAQPANAVMQAQESGGVIINIGSVAGRQAEPGTAAYAAAKAGLLQLTRALALEWAPKVRVNHVTVGLIMTEAAASYYGEDGGASVARTIAMGRMAEPDDVAAACLYLASPQAGYVTGADLEVHGGGEVPARYLAARRPDGA